MLEELYSIDGKDWNLVVVGESDSEKEIIVNSKKEQWESVYKCSNEVSLDKIKAFSNRYLDNPITFIVIKLDEFKGKGDRIEHF
jgi:hypothetical protein